MSPTYSTDPPLDQAQPSGLGTVNAQGFGKGSAGQEVIPDPPVSSPAISTDAYGDDVWPPGFEGSSSASVPASHAPAAQRLGARVIRSLKKGKATNLAVKPVRFAKPRPVKPARAARARAAHSHAAHGGSRKANDDGSSDSGDDGPPRRRKPKPKRRGPRQIETGWARFNQFPSHMGRKIAPGECNYASSAALQVAVIGPKHDRQSGSPQNVRSVSSGKITTVVLRECVETHARIPISFYKFKRISSSHEVMGGCHDLPHISNHPGGGTAGAANG